MKAEPGESPSDTTAPALGTSARWVVFCLDASRYALPLITVDRIVRAVQVTALPLAPDIVLGAVDVAGRVLPVLNLRRRFRLPERPIDPADQFLIARTTLRTVVLVIDAAQGVLERPTTAMIDAVSIAPGLGHIQGVFQTEDGLVLIHDLEHFLSPDETLTLDAAMDQRATHAG